MCVRLRGEGSEVFRHFHCLEMGVGLIFFLENEGGVSYGIEEPPYPLYADKK